MANIATRALGLISGIAASVMPAAPIAYIDERSDDYYLLLEERSIENPAIPLGQINSWGDLGGGGGNSLSGVNIGPDSALKVSAVYRAVNIIAETVARLPLAVFTETPNGRDIDPTDQFQKIIDREPNEFMAWFDFLHTMVSTALLWGNAYAQIIRDSYYRPIGLRYLRPGQCSPMYVDEGATQYLYYFVFGQVVEKRDIIHIRCLGNDGVIGKSPIALFRESIGLAKAAEEYGARFFGQGGNMSGTLETDQSFKDEGAINRLRKQFEDRYSGLGNAHKPLILEQGMKYNRISIPPDDAQFIETRNFQIEDIGRVFGVPQHMLGKLDKSTNNNIEHQGIEFKNYTILPWTERISQEFKRKLIAERDKPSKSIVFDVDQLDAGDSTARGNLYKALFNVGAITPNEIRRKENLNRLDGLDDPMIQINMARLTADSHQAPKEPASPQTPPTTNNE